jgi:hypothetical protein
MFYAILFNMDSFRSFWPDWLNSLQQKRLSLWVAWALDAAGPLNLLGAQFVHLTSPFLGDSEKFKALACILEDESETREFITFLREHS